MATVSPTLVYTFVSLQPDDDLQFFAGSPTQWPIRTVVKSTAGHMAFAFEMEPISLTLQMFILFLYFENGAVPIIELAISLLSLPIVSASIAGPSLFS